FVLQDAAWAPDGKLLATVSFNEVTLWDATGETLKERTKLKGARAPVAFSPEGKLLATRGPGATGRLWDVSGPEPKVLHTLDDLPEHSPAPAALAFSPDGKRLATTGSQSRLFLWDAATGKRLRTWQF